MKAGEGLSKLTSKVMISPRHMSSQSCIENECEGRIDGTRLLHFTFNDNERPSLRKDGLAETSRVLKGDEERGEEKWGAIWSSEA